MRALAGFTLSLLLFSHVRAWGLGVPAAYDFDGDGVADIAVYHRAAGNWFIRESADGASRLQNWGWGEAVPVAGDFDGDGVTDVAVYHRPAGDWYIQESSTGNLRLQNFGWAEAQPVPADYDGDGTTDLAVYHRLSGNWFLLMSTDGFLLQNWGWVRARPVPGDYDGDGKADLVVYDPEFGDWYIRQSTDVSLRLVNWGWFEARPVCGDFDGDDTADLTVYHPPSGNWFILQSATGSGREQNWGWVEAGPVAADYDGDGIDDIAVYHPPSGEWFILPSAGGGLFQQNWGWVEARAVPAYGNGATEYLKVHSHGNSITFGRGSSSDGPQTGYPILLERKLEGSHGGDFVSFNFGVPGETTSEGRARLNRNLAASQPNVLLLMEGTNDHFFETDFGVIENNLRSMVAAAQAQGIFVVIATIPPVISNGTTDRSEQQERIVAFNPRIYAIAADFGIPVAPVFETLTAVPGWQSLLMEQSSGNHPNDLGYLFVRDAFFNALTPFINAGVAF